MGEITNLQLDETKKRLAMMIELAACNTDTDRQVLLSRLDKAPRRRCLVVANPAAAIRATMEITNGRAVEVRDDHQQRIEATASDHAGSGRGTPGQIAPPGRPAPSGTRTRSRLAERRFR